MAPLSRFIFSGIPITALLAYGGMAKAANPFVHRLFNNNMVLQRGVAAPVSGIGVGRVALPLAQFRPAGLDHIGIEAADILTSIASHRICFQTKPMATGSGCSLL